MPPAAGCCHRQLVIRVLTVDDHAVVRSGIVSLLRSEEGILPVSAVSSCEAALVAFEQLRPDVVIADFRLTDGDGLTLCRRLERDDWPARVLIFSGFAEANLAVAATIAGAAGMLGKGTAGELLLAAVRAVADGGMPVPAVPAESLKNAAGLLDPDDLPIFGMRLEGLPANEIATVLHLDRETVESRIDRIVDTLKPRVEARAVGRAPAGRTVGRWL
jgi:DNA-binding NarL/FixJ family response regulator